MKLTDLNATFVAAGPAGDRVGVMLDCPCGCSTKLWVPFLTPKQSGWVRQGDTLETLTLSPSVQRRRPSPGEPDSGCANAWHGYITNGEARSV